MPFTRGWHHRQTGWNVSGSCETDAPASSAWESLATIRASLKRSTRTLQAPGYFDGCPERFRSNRKRLHQAGSPGT